MLRAALVLALASGCTSDSVVIVFEGEDLVYNLDVKAHTIGQGLMVRVAVIHLHEEFDYPDPDERHFSADELTVDLDGATQVECDVPFTGICLIADDVDRISLSVDTPAGGADASRPVTKDLHLATFTPRWGRAPVDKIQVAAFATSPIHPVFMNSAGVELAGHALDYETSFGLTLDGGKLIAGPSGQETITAVGTAAPPLSVRVIDEQTSLATVASFDVDRVWGRSGRTLTAYTKGSVGAVIFDAFDADGYLAIAGLPLVVTPGPGIKASSYPQAGFACRTNDYCFLRGVLDDGVDELDSFVDVSAGTAKQRFPVRVVRGEY